MLLEGECNQSGGGC